MQDWLVILCVVALLLFVSNQKLPFVEGYSTHMYPYDSMPEEEWHTHGLRGNKLNPVDIRTKYIWPDSHWRIGASSGVHYESRRPPLEEKCDKVSCPPIFDSNLPNTHCWYCKK